MLNLIEALKFCGFEECPPHGDSPFCDSEVWSGGGEYQQAIGVADDWQGWEWEKNGVSRLFWRNYPCLDDEGWNYPEHEEVVIYCDRIVIIDRTHHRLATTCRCESEGCALAAELVRAWFATGR